MTIVAWASISLGKLMPKVPSPLLPSDTFSRMLPLLGHVDMTNQKLHALDIKTKLASLRTAIC